MTLIDMECEWRVNLIGAKMICMGDVCDKHDEIDNRNKLVLALACHEWSHYVLKRYLATVI